MEREDERMKWERCKMMTTKAHTSWVRVRSLLVVPGWGDINFI